ncbi:unnamed protein product [Amoebophrya sp. A120]|nr:unnamed protein product [Amoebophrya sp. A120]|eukprot:GSA120T00002114001.1
MDRLSVLDRELLHALLVTAVEHIRSAHEKSTTLLTSTGTETGNIASATANKELSPAGTTPRGGNVDSNSVVASSPRSLPSQQQGSPLGPGAATKEDAGTVESSPASSPAGGKRLWGRLQGKLGTLVSAARADGAARDHLPNTPASPDRAPAGALHFDLDDLFSASPAQSPSFSGAKRWHGFGGSPLSGDKSSLEQGALEVDDNLLSPALDYSNGNNLPLAKMWSQAPYHEKTLQQARERTAGGFFPRNKVAHQQLLLSDEEQERRWSAQRARLRQQLRDRLFGMGQKQAFNRLLLRQFGDDVDRMMGAPVGEEDASRSGSKRRKNLFIDENMERTLAGGATGVHNEAASVRASRLPSSVNRDRPNKAIMSNRGDVKKVKVMIKSSDEEVVHDAAKAFLRPATSEATRSKSRGAVARARVAASGGSMTSSGMIPGPRVAGDLPTEEMSQRTSKSSQRPRVLPLKRPASSPVATSGQDGSLLFAGSAPSGQKLELAGGAPLPPPKTSATEKKQGSTAFVQNHRRTFMLEAGRKSFVHDPAPAAGLAAHTEPNETVVPKPGMPDPSRIVIGRADEPLSVGNLQKPISSVHQAKVAAKVDLPKKAPSPSAKFGAKIHGQPDRVTTAKGKSNELQLQGIVSKIEKKLS